MSPEKFNKAPAALNSFREPSALSLLRFTGRRWPRRRAYAIAVLTCLSFVSLRLALGFHEPPFLSLLFPAVIISAYVGGMETGLLATLIIAVGTVYFVLPPQGGLSVTNDIDQAQVIVLFFNGFLVSTLTEALHSASARADRSAAAERLLRERLEGIAEASPEAIHAFRRSADGHISFPYASRAMLDLYAVSPEQLTEDATPAMALIHPDDIARVHTSIVRSETAMTPFSEEWRVRHPERGEIWVEGHSRPARQPDGSTIWFGTLKDISVRKRDERLRQQWSDAFSYCAHGIALGDPRNNTILACNPAFAALLQKPVEDIVGHPILDVYAPHVQAAIPRFIAEADRTGHVQYVTQLRRSDGIYLDAQMDLVSVRDSQEQIIYRVATLQDISQRLAAEAALRQSESRLQQLLNGLPQLIWTCTPAGECDFLSEQWVNYTGVSASEQLGNRWAAHIHPDDVDHLLQQWEQCVKSGQALTINYRIRRYDGEYHWFDTRAIPVHDDHGNIVHWYGSNTDIQHTHDSNERLQQLLNGLPQLIWTCTPAGECDFLSEQWVNYTGVSASEQLGNRWAAHIHPDDVDHLLQQWEQCVMTGQPMAITYRIRRHDGEYRWFDTRAIPIYDDNGNIVHWYGSNTDIQDSHEMHERLRQQATILDLAYDPMFVFDPDWGIVYWNRGCEQRYGYGSADVQGRLPHSLLQTEFPDSYAHFMGELHASGHWQGELQHKTSNGETVVVLSQMQELVIDNHVLVLEVNHDITERKAMERELAESEAKYRTLMDALPVGVFIAQDYCFQFANPAMPRLLGYRFDEFVGRTFAEIISPEHLSLWCERFEQRIGGDTKPPGNYELRMLGKAGDPLWIELNASRVTYKGRLAVLGIVRDISERKATEETLRLWAQTFERAEFGLAIGDPTNNTIKMVNPAFARERGYTPEELAGKPILSLFPPDKMAEVKERIARMDSEAHGAFESEHLTKDGRRFPVWLDVTVLQSAAGEPRQRVACAINISARKAAEAALRESEARMKLFIRYAPVAIAMFDRNMCYLAFSRRWANIYGLDESTLMGRLHYEVFPEISATWKEIHQRALAGEVIRAEEDRFERADGTIQWLRWEVRPWQADDNTVGGIVIFSEDITERKNIQLEIEQLNANLEVRIRERTDELHAANQELESFAFAVSHDLRAPLRAMHGFSQALVEDFRPALDAEARSYIDQVQLASKHMSELIDGLLVLSRSTLGELVRCQVDLTAMAHRILDDLARHDPQRQVQYSVVDGLSVQGDPRMLELVLQNVLANAWKYTSTRVTAHIRFYSLTMNDEPCFCVEDDGAGFDMAFADKLFKPFQRLHRQSEFPGLGIGLATVQRIIQRHGGRIWAQSETGKGSKFYFVLPVLRVVA